MATKPGFVMAKPKKGGAARLVPEHYISNPRLGFVKVESLRETSGKAVRAIPESNQSQEGDAK